MKQRFSAPNPGTLTSYTRSAHHIEINLTSLSLLSLIISSCNHAALLQLASNDSLSLCDTGRLGQICRMLPDPARQKPSLIFFPGAGSKNNALSYLFQLERLKKGARDGGNSLRIDRSTIHSDHPLLIAESDIEPPPPKSLQYVNCHENRAHKIAWSSLTSDCLWMSLHVRLFYLFADIICIFASDFGGMEGVVRYLRTCSKAFLCIKCSTTDSPTSFDRIF